MNHAHSGKLDQMPTARHFQDHSCKKTFLLIFKQKQVFYFPNIFLKEKNIGQQFQL